LLVVSMLYSIRTTSEEGPRSIENGAMEQSYWMRALNWSHGLYMRVQDRRVANQVRINLHGPMLERKPKEEELMIWRTKMQARVQDKVQLKDSICFKWVQIGS
jgi:hypothetical protein